MASPDRSKRKIFKAKKTMPASCRKQAEILNKSKNVEALKTAAPGSNLSSGNQNSSTGVISSKCKHSENDASSLDSNKNSLCSQKSKIFSENLIKPLKIVDSETRLDYIEEQVVCPYQKPSKTTESSRKLLTQDAKDSQNTSDNHLECQANVTRSFFEQHEENCNMTSICRPSGVLSGIVQTSKFIVINTLDDKKINKMVSYLETNSNFESHDKRQNDISSSDTCSVPLDKIPKLVNSVISSNYTADILKSEESCGTCHSSIDCESTSLMCLSSLDTASNNSHNPKKRMFSENKENVKRMKTSEQINENICVALEKQTALLEQVKHLIQQEICSKNYTLFDNKLKELTERIGKTQCRNKHEAIADELFAKIAKLQRRIKTVLLSQKNCLEPNVLSSNIACKIANSETMNLDKNPVSVNSPGERKTSVNSEPSNPSEKASGKINLSREHDEAVSERVINWITPVVFQFYTWEIQSPVKQWFKKITQKKTMKNVKKMGKAVTAELKKLIQEVYGPEHIFDEEGTYLNRKKMPLCAIIFKDENNNDDVMLISVESPNLKTPITSNPTDSGRIISENYNNSTDAETEVMAVEKKKFDTVIDLTKEGLSNCNTESPVSTLESPMKAVSISKEKTPVAQNAAQVLESFEHLPPLPEPPPLLPELVDKIRDTLPPQKPELKVKRVLRPRGIALTWNITKINPKCAPVESYHLFLCHENPSNKLIWKKIGEIKALPLPMACTLSQFLASNKYYFTVQSKDIFGRYGPFCDIKSIPGFSENLT